MLCSLFRLRISTTPHYSILITHMMSLFFIRSTVGCFLTGIELIKSTTLI